LHIGIEINEFHNLQLFLIDRVNVPITHILGCGVVVFFTGNVLPELRFVSKKG